MPEKRRMTLKINGVKYHITTEEAEGYVGELAHEIDHSLRGLLDSSRMSTNEGLVLLCLSYLDLYRKTEQGADNLRVQIAEYLEEAAKARLEAGEARKELERLEARLKAREKEGKRG